MMKHRHRKVFVLFGIYCLFMIWIILLKASFSIEDIRLLTSTGNVNWIPFYYDRAVTFHLKEVLYNIFIFVPFAVYLKMMNLPSKHVILTGVLFSFLMECLQLIFQIGAADITDLITNIFGTIIGIILYAVLKKLLKRETNRVLYYCAIICTLLLLFPIVLLALYH